MPESVPCRTSHCKHQRGLAALARSVNQHYRRIGQRFDQTGARVPREKADTSHPAN